jgi:hypothetical protein
MIKICQNITSLHGQEQQIINNYIVLEKLIKELSGQNIPANIRKKIQKLREDAKKVDTFNAAESCLNQALKLIPDQKAARS